MAAEAGRNRRRGPRFVARILGATLIVGGILCVTWAGVVWRWGDPITALYNRSEQRALRNDYAVQASALQAQFGLRRAVAGSGQPSLAKIRRQLKRNAAVYRERLGVGDPVGVLVIPRLGLRSVVVEGTDDTSLKRGPGRDRRTYVPGQDELVYIAGHRTTYGAPFARIDVLRGGDTVGLETPYGKFSYVVTGHRIVAADELDVLRSAGREHLALQACHPRFLATQRYIADARLVSVAVPDSDGTWRTYSFGPARTLQD